MFGFAGSFLTSTVERDRVTEREEGDDVDGDIDGGGKQQRQQQLMIYADS